MTRKPQPRRIATRAKVLQAAKDLSARHGLDQVTSDAVAAEAGVAKGTVFSHFGDMDGLLSHILLDRLDALRAPPPDHVAFASAAGQMTDPVGLLIARMMQLIEVITESQAIMRLFLDNIGVTKPNCAEDFVETLEALDAELAAFLDLWQRSGTISPALRQDRSPEEMMDGLIAFMIHGAILRESLQVSDMDELEHRLRRHVEALLLAC